jgi:hypothetical protein
MTEVEEQMQMKTSRLMVISNLGPNNTSKFSRLNKIKVHKCLDDLTSWLTHLYLHCWRTSRNSSAFNCYPAPKCPISRANIYMSSINRESIRVRTINPLKGLTVHVDHDIIMHTWDFGRQNFKVEWLRGSVLGS